MGEICNLFQDAPDRLRKKYIQLLEKFEIALQLTETQVIIPSLMPPFANYPKPNDTLNDITMNVDSYYQPPMRRFWLADYIPDGFWPRLICRIATDQQIGKVNTNSDSSIGTRGTRRLHGPLLHNHGSDLVLHAPI